MLTLTQVLDRIDSAAEGYRNLAALENAAADIMQATRFRIGGMVEIYCMMVVPNDVDHQCRMWHRVMADIGVIP